MEVYAHHSQVFGFIIHIFKKRTCPTFQLGGEEISNKPTTVHVGMPLGDVTDNVIASLISKGKHSLGATQGLTRSGIHVLHPNYTGQYALWIRGSRTVTWLTEKNRDCTQADGKTSASSPRMYTRPSNSCPDGLGVY